MKSKEVFFEREVLGAPAQADINKQREGKVDGKGKIGNGVKFLGSQEGWDPDPE